MENYVILSDLHLGEKVHECTFADPVNISRFAKELEPLGKIKELVLLGDFLELSLAPISKVTEQMKDFFGHIHRVPEKIIYVPGNHDHHIWALHVEQEIIQEMKKGNPLKCLPDYVDTEFDGADSFVSGYLPASSQDKLTIKYPIHKIELSSDKRCLLHHGHQIYGVGVRLLSLEEAQKEISEEKQMQELELQNIGVYELLGFYLELSGRMRRRIETQWDENGGFGAFSVVAKEMADSRVANILLSVGRIFSGPNDRGRTIAENKEEISQYLKVYGRQIECLIYGHSHVPELVYGSELRHNIPAKIIGNCGSWLKGRRRHNTYIVINADGVELRELGEKDAMRYIPW